MDKVISNWRDMNKFGFNVLTGEACGLGYRGLIDLTADALEIVKRTVGAVEIKAPSDYNGGDAVCSMLMPYSMLEPLAVFALFTRGNCQHVVIEYASNTYSGLRVTGFDGTYTRESITKLLQENRIESYRLLTYPEQRPGVTAGLSNVHQMSGRTA